MVLSRKTKLYVIGLVFLLICMLEMIVVKSFGVFGVNIMLTQKMLYEFLVMYMSFWRQHNVDAKRCYIRFGVNKRLTLKDICCCKNVLFFTSTHR